MVVCLLKLISCNEDELMVGEKKFTVVTMFMSAYRGFGVSDYSDGGYGIQ